MLPSLLVFSVTNARRGFMYKDRHKTQYRANLVLSCMSGLSLLGSLVFIFADSISEWYIESYVATNKSARSYALSLGITGFILMQLGLIVSQDSITEMLMQSNSSHSQPELWIFRCKGIGRMAGFLLASLDIFEKYSLSLYYVIFI